MYERFINELKSYSKAICILSKGYIPILLKPPSELEIILQQVKSALAKINKNYDLVLNRLFLYYDMKLVMFGIDNDRNLIIQFQFLLNHTLRLGSLCTKWRQFQFPFWTQ